MSLIDQHFEEALQGLPEQKLSWRANRRIRKMLTSRAREMEGRMSWSAILQRLIAVPVALVLILASTGTFAFYSPGVVRGDFLYPVKPAVEQLLYPEEGSSEERVTFHLWLSDRRFSEVNEILRRLGKQSVALIPAVLAEGLEQNGSGNDSLDQALTDTLENALQNEDYALLISGEIQDTDRLKAVHGQIRSSIEKHKAFVETFSPLLLKVKLAHKEKARQKTVREIEPVENSAGPMTLSFGSVVEKPAEIDNVGDLLEDHFAFQESLLETHETAGDRTANEDRRSAILKLDERFGDDAEVRDEKVFSRAFKAHDRENKKMESREGRH